MTYFNEIDPFCAQWVRNAFGTEVDERDIRDIQYPVDAVRQHYFAGIGGWEYALRVADWPDAREVWTGSCPCQPLSVAGHRRGASDRRHLWPAFLKLIALRRPAAILGEQVASADGRIWLTGVRANLEDLGYAVGAADLCAAGVGAPHIRQRLYWVALRLDHAGWQRDERWRETRDLRSPASDAQDPRLQRQRGGDADRGAGPDGGVALADREGQGFFRFKSAANGDPSSGHDAHRSGETGRLAFAAGPRLDDPRKYGSGQSLLPARPEQRGSAGGLGDPGDEGLQGPSERFRNGGQSRRFTTSATRYGWAASTTIRCSDGRWRRVPVEPSLQPLAANGRFGNPRRDSQLSSRIGALKGSGNAIVIPLAAEFIRAVMDLL